MVKEDKNQAKNPLVQAIKEAYKAGQEDEALEPIVVTDSSGQPAGRLCKGDYVIFYDIRGEREIELTQSLVDKDFSQFPVDKDLDLNFVTMIEYDLSLKVKVAFPPDEKIRNTLGEVLSQAGLNVLKISESEKAVHVGYFMNGKNEDIFPGEKRVVVPSPERISSYASTPKMSAGGVTAEISSNLKNPSYRVLIANFANVMWSGISKPRKQ